MHANMPLGSRPDFLRHTVVESCTSSTFDVAFCIIENNWIPSPPSAPPRLSRTRTYTRRFRPCSRGACSVNRPPVRRRQRHVCLVSRRFGAAFHPSAAAAAAGPERQTRAARPECWGTAFRCGSRVILQVGVAPASECKQSNVWERWRGPLGLCCSTSVSAWPSIRKESVWPAGCWLLSTLGGTADNQQRERDP